MQALPAEAARGLGGIDGVQQDRMILAVQTEGEQQNGAAAKRKRKGPSVKERLMRCQRTERERLTFGKVSTAATLMTYLTCFHPADMLHRPQDACWNQAGGCAVTNEWYRAEAHCRAMLCIVWVQVN